MIKKILIKLGIFKDKKVLKKCNCNNTYIDYEVFEKRYISVCDYCLPF